MLPSCRSGASKGTGEGQQGDGGGLDALASEASDDSPRRIGKSLDRSASPESPGDQGRSSGSPSRTQSGAPSSIGQDPLTESIKRLIDENRWVKGEASDVHQAMRGGLDSLYYRQKVVTARAGRLKASQRKIDLDYQTQRAAHEQRIRGLAGADFQ